MRTLEFINASYNLLTKFRIKKKKKKNGASFNLTYTEVQTPVGGQERWFKT